MDQLAFLSEEKIRDIGRRFGTPVFVYDQETLEARTRDLLRFSARVRIDGTVRHEGLTNGGSCADTEPGGAAHRCQQRLRSGAGNTGGRTSGADPAHGSEDALEIWRGLVRQGVRFNACSLQQLSETTANCFPGRSVTVRINPGLGSGHSKKTNVGGPSASFGIWHEHMSMTCWLSPGPADYRISSMHTHIGSGSDPEVWEHCAMISLRIAARLPEVEVLSLGGGFKVGRMPGEASTDLKRIGTHVMEAFRAFRSEHGRRLRLEVEPGTFLVANAGALICAVIDCVDTGRDGYEFLKVDAGMTELLRISLYGAQHPIMTVPARPGSRRQREYLVAGHCCESGDVLTPAPADPEGLRPRLLAEAGIGDLLAVGGFRRVLFRHGVEELQFVSRGRRGSAGFRRHAAPDSETTNA